MTLMNTYAPIPLSFPKGDGVFLFDQSNNKYLDLMSGIGVNSLGYNNEIIQNALAEAITKPMHVSNLYEIPEQQKLAKILCKNSHFDQTFFCNSGTEANEAAIKLVRKYQNSLGNSEKNIIVSFSSSFHGRTMGSLSITGKDSIKTGFTPLIGNTHTLEWNNTEALEDYLKNSGNNVAGIFIEPIQGEGGINLPNEEFLQKIEKLCKTFNIVLVADEVQTGIGRTGTKFAFEQFGIKPDVICLAKGMGGGVPIGAILATKEIAEAFTPGSHGTTFGGNPFVCSVSSAVCEEILTDKFLENVKNSEKYLFDAIQNIINTQKKGSEILEEIRGLGLMIGIEINSVKNRNLLIEKFRKENILLLPSGEKTLRLLPPLIITKQELSEFITVFQKILKTL